MTSKASGHNSVRKVYLDVIDDVISNVSEMFADEGVDENVLQELRTLWNKKLKESKALESPPEDRRMPGDDKGKVSLSRDPRTGSLGPRGPTVSAQNSVLITHLELYLFDPRIRSKWQPRSTGSKDLYNRKSTTTDYSFDQSATNSKNCPTWYQTCRVQSSWRKFWKTTRTTNCLSDTTKW